MRVRPVWSGERRVGRFVEFVEFMEFMGRSQFEVRWFVGFVGFLEFVGFVEFVGRRQFGVGHAYRESHRCSACHALSGSNGPSIARMISSAR